MSDSDSSAEASEPADRPIGLRTLVDFLIGRRDAILRLAGNRSTLWVGFLFVLSAGFAREYDGEDLLAEPWHLLTPLAASVGSSLVLFLLVFAAARRRNVPEGTACSLYRQFLGLYWMTAPLAWVYAIPVERIFSAPDSVRANLWLLGLVALWRVVLMIRVIHVLYGAGTLGAAVLVLAFGDVLVFVLMQTVDLPLLQIMGGVRLSESQQTIVGVASTLLVLSVLTAPIWLAGTLGVLFGRLEDWKLAVLPASTTSGVSRGLRSLVAASLAVWLTVLPITQPEQRRRAHVDRLVAQGELDAAIRLMDEAGPGAFPTHWTPPPHVSRRGIDVDLLVDFLTRLEEPGSPDWLRFIYWAKLGDAVHNSFSFSQYWDQAASKQRLALVELLERQPGERIAELFGSDQDSPLGWSRRDDTELGQQLEQRLLAIFVEEEDDESSTRSAPPSDDFPTPAETANDSFTTPSP